MTASQHTMFITRWVGEAERNPSLRRTSIAGEALFLKTRLELTAGEPDCDDTNNEHK